MFNQKLLRNATLQKQVYNIKEPTTTNPKGVNMTTTISIKTGNYVKSVQSRVAVYQIKAATADTVTLKRVNGRLNGEYEVPRSTFSKYFHPAT